MRNRERQITIRLNRRELKGSIVEPKTSKDLAVFVHGFLSNQDFPPFLKAAKIFSKKDISVFRFNVDISPYTSKKDLQYIIKHFLRRDKELRIHLVGHSLGAIVVLLASQKKIKNVKSITLWEPSREPFEIFNSLPFDEKNKVYIAGGKTGTKIPEKIVKRTHKLPKVAKLLSKVLIPIKLIGVKDGGYKITQTYYKYIRSSKKLKIIEKGGHNFNGPSSSRQVLLETMVWIEKHKKDTT